MCPDLVDSMELERTVNSLNQKLAESHKVEEELRAKLQELDRVDGLVKQVGTTRCPLTAVMVVEEHMFTCDPTFR